ncbi:MAG: DUF222 domain-containing protein, partial [Nocardioidaceae bacterium]
PVPQTDPGVRSGLETAQRPGGPGTPEMAEFAVDELATATGCSTGRAFFQLGDALDLRHRMPALFGRLRAGQVPVSKVRLVLRAAHTLPLPAARRLDQQIAASVERLGPRRLAAEVEKVLIEVDPAEADRRARAALERRGVTVTRDDEGGGCRIFADVDVFDGLAFDAAADHVADLLGDLGDERCKDIRRAAAVGWLANPPATVALVARHRAWAAGAQPIPSPTTDMPTSTDTDGDPRLTPGLWRLDVPTPHDLIDAGLWASADVLVHLDLPTWTQAQGPADVTGHGPITTDQVFDRLRHHQVTIKPVIDLNDDIRWHAPNHSDYTGTLREAVQLANPWNPFPYADAPTRATDDIDHTQPRNHGGTTTLNNAAPLRRRLHRVKTFANGWRVKQPFTGLHIWQSPERRIYICDRRGHTHDLGPPDTGPTTTTPDSPRPTTRQAGSI